MASEAENDKKGIESIDEKVQFSEFKSDIKTLDIGLETLSLIDQIEMMNSLNSSLLNKNCKKLIKYKILLKIEKLYFF